MVFDNDIIFHFGPYYQFLKPVLLLNMMVDSSLSLLEAVLCVHPDTSAHVCPCRMKGPEPRADASLISPCPCHTDYCVLFIFSYLKGYSIVYL